LRRLTGPLGRRLLLVLLVAGASLVWVYSPPQPLFAWDHPTDRLIDDAVLAPDGLTFVGLERSYPGQPNPIRDSARLWHLPSGRAITAISGEAGLWPDIRLAPDSSWFATQDRYTVISLRDTADGRVRGELVPPNSRDPGPRNMGRWRPFTVSPDGRHIATWADPPEPPTVRLHDTTTGRPTVTLDGAIGPIAFSPDGRTLVTGLPRDADAAIALWEVGTGHILNRFGDATTDRPGAIAFSPDGRRLAAGLPQVEVVKGRWSHDITVWDVPTHRAVVTLPVKATPRSYFPRNTGGSGLEFSPDGRFLVVRGIGYGLFWDLAADAPRCLDELLDIYGDHPELGRVAFGLPLFSPDGARFVVPSHPERKIAIYDTATVTPRGVVTIGFDGFRRPLSALSPDGRWLAVACRGLSSYPSRLEAWLARIVGRQFFWSGTHAHVKIVKMATAAEVGRIPTDAAVLGFAADSRSFWTYTQTPTTVNYPTTNPTTLEVRQWAVPSGWPPAWLVVVTAVGILLIAADWQRGRRRRAPAGVVA
jgi:WD40 repeat protein